MEANFRLERAWGSWTNGPEQLEGEGEHVEIAEGKEAFKDLGGHVRRTQDPT